MSVDGGINAHTEDVLVVLGQDAGTDDVAPGSGLACLDADGRDNASSTCLNSDSASLVEYVLQVWNVSWAFHKQKKSWDRDLR